MRAARWLLVRIIPCALNIRLISYCVEITSFSISALEAKPMTSSLHHPPLESVLNLRRLGTDLYGIGSLGRVLKESVVRVEE